MQKKKPLLLSLTIYEGNKLEQFSITNEEQAEEAKAHLLKAANGKLACR